LSQKKRLDEDDDLTGRYPEVWVKHGQKPRRLDNIEPNRQFPPPGKPLDHLRQKGGPTDPNGNRINDKDTGIPIPLLEETRELLQLIELVQPIRIASLHAHSVGRKEKGIDAPGVFVDPRYQYDIKKCLDDPMDPKDPQKRKDFGLDSQGNPNPFVTNPCKFDLAKDPAFPVVGLIKQLNDQIAHLKHSDPDVQKVKSLIEETQKLFAQENKDKDNPGHAASQAKANEAADWATKTLKFRQVQETSDMAQTRDDDRLALAIAQEARRQRIRVPGNWLDDRGMEVVHYAQSAPPKPGFSLGDWGPVDVSQGPGRRPGAPVITVEVYHQYESGAFENGELRVDKNCTPEWALKLDDKTKTRARERCRELQAYAEALIRVFLGFP